MTSLISAGIEVSIETQYQPESSNPVLYEFLFAYRVTLENHNRFSVKLLRRQWLIFDSVSEHREVEGEGVVGIQPIIEPGETYSYTSGCNLRSEMGRMRGKYQMLNLDTQTTFNVQIPEFELITPFRYN